MTNHIITQEQFDQALRDRVLSIPIEPQPPNGYEYSFTVDGSHIWARAKDMAFATPAKFQPQDNLYVGEEWYDSGPFCYLKSEFDGEDMRFATAKLQPASTMPINLAEKILVVDRVEVELVRNHKRSFDESRMVEEWHNKIFVEVKNDR